MGLLCTLRFFSIRHLVACPVIPLFLCPSRCTLKFFSVPCFQRLSHSGDVQPIKDERGEVMPDPGRTLNQRTLPRTNSEALLKGGVFSSGPMMPSPDVSMTGEDVQEAGTGNWSKDSRNNTLDLPVVDGDRTFSMQLLNRGTMEADEKEDPSSVLSFFRVTKEKLELRSQIVTNILHKILSLQDVTVVRYVLNEWLRKFASGVDISSTGDRLSGFNNYSTGRFVPYAQVARITHSVMQELGRGGHLEAALEVLRWMERQGWCQLDPHMYTTIIATLGEAGSFELAEKIFERLEITQVEKDPALFNAMLNARGKAGQIDLLDDLFESMKNSACMPDLVTYNTVMNSYVKAGMGLGTVVDVFREMYSQGIDPDLVSFDILLQSCISGRHVKEAQKIFGNLKKRGLTPSVVTYTTLITLYANSGHCTEALKLLSDMVGENCHPNTQTFSSLITACGRDGNIEEAERLFQTMRELGVEPNVVTYNAMIDMYGKGGHCEMALQKYEELERAGIKPTGVTLTSVMCSLKASGLYEEVLAFYNQAKQDSICNEHVFSEAIDTYIKFGKLHRIKGVQTDMVAANCSPNVVTCSIVLAALGSKCSNADDAGVLVNFLQGFDSDLAVNACRMLLERMSSDDEVIYNIQMLFTLLDKEELRTWTVFTCALVDALWALGWYRRAAHVMAWVMGKGIFEDICVIQPQEWKLDLRRLSSGTSLVALHQWFAHLVIIAGHLKDSDVVTSVTAYVGEAVGEVPSQPSGGVEHTAPADVELLLPLLPAISESPALKGLQETPKYELGGELPPLITVVTGWGKLSKQEGTSTLKTLVQNEILKLRAPFRPSGDSGRWMTTADLLMPWLMSPTTAARLALFDLAPDIDSVQ